MAAQEHGNFIIKWNGKKGFSCRQVVCRQTNFWFLHKFSSMNSPVKILSRVGETKLFVKYNQKVNKQKAKSWKFISENFVLSRTQETSI